MDRDSNGLHEYDPDCDCFRRYLSDLDDPTTLGDKAVLSIWEDRSGALWVGTFGGLNQLDRESGTFVRYTERDGLPNEVIYGILEDDSGFLWLSTNMGVSQFDPRRKVFRNYDSKDGLQSNEFLPGSYYKNAQGEMFFGGRNGFNAFYPNRVAENPHVPEIVITDFQAISETRSLDRIDTLRSWPAMRGPSACLTGTGSSLSSLRRSIFPHRRKTPTPSNWRGSMTTGSTSRIADS